MLQNDSEIPYPVPVNTDLPRIPRFEIIVN
jgi:hypothetical protein